MPSRIRDWHPVEQMQWEIDCVGFHGEVLQGEFSHYCEEWDSLPIDETCQEFEACTCQFKDWDNARAEVIRGQLLDERLNRPESPPSNAVTPTLSQSQDSQNAVQEPTTPTRDLRIESRPPRSGSQKSRHSTPKPARRRRT